MMPAGFKKRTVEISEKNSLQEEGRVLPPLPLALRKQQAFRRIVSVFTIIAVLISFYLSDLFHLDPWTGAFSGIWMLVAEAFPPSTGPVLPRLLHGAVESIVIAISAITLSFVLALPLSFLAANKTTPHPLIAYGMRSFFGAIRSIPELIMAIIFVAAMGFGTLPGVMALTVISLGMLGRFFYEAIDRVRQGPIDAVTATGVNKLLIIIYGILPQILTEIFDYSIYRFECNLRASTYIGIVGAGGMGFQIILSLRLMQYQDLLTGIIVVYILINSAEMIGKFLRQKFFH